MKNVKVIIWGLGAMGGGMADMLLQKKGVEIAGVAGRGDKIGKSMFDYIKTERGGQPDVKIQAAETPPGKKHADGRRNSSAGYRSLHLWIKLCSGDSCTMPENVNLQIEKLLETYKQG